MSDGMRDNPYACLKPAEQRMAQQELDFLIHFLAKVQTAEDLAIHCDGGNYGVRHLPDFCAEIIKTLKLRIAILQKEIN